MAGVGIAVFWLAYVFSLHIIMVNLGIYLGLIVPYLKYRAKKMNDPGIMRLARNLMKFYAATYGVAGVFATAFTVFLLSFYPNFLGVAGNIALAPFAIAILMIVVHFLSIAAYYYGWDRLSEPIHNTFGFLLALSSLLIPLGFRSVFAFLNYPKGLYFSGGALHLDVTQALANATLPPLYLKSITAAITAGALATGGFYAVHTYRVRDEAYKKALGVYVEKTVKIALIGLVLMFFFGLWYSLALEKYAPYKFNNIFASLGWKAGDGTVAFNVSWLFVLKMILYVAQLYIVYKAYKIIKKSGGLDRASATQLLYAGLLALLTIALGELLNAFSQFPRFIANLEPLKTLPPEVVQQAAPALSLLNVNQLATIGSVQALTVGFMIFLSLSALWFLYELLKDFIENDV